MLIRVVFAFAPPATITPTLVAAVETSPFTSPASSLFEAAEGRLQRFIAGRDLLVAPDLLRFEVYRAMARLNPSRSRC